MGNFLVVLTSLFLLLGSQPSSLNKKEFYEVLSKATEKSITQYITTLDKVVAKEKEAYKGALLMTQAGVASGPKKKLDLFKQGAKKLEAEIQKDKQNPEYRFLRVMIQENAPGILGYKNNLQEDKTLLLSSYKSLDPVVLEALLDYSKNSKILQREDFLH